MLREHRSWRNAAFITVKGVVALMLLTSRTSLIRVSATLLRMLERNAEWMRLEDILSGLWTLVG